MAYKWREIALINSDVTSKKHTARTLPSTARALPVLVEYRAVVSSTLQRNLYSIR